MNQPLPPTPVSTPTPPPPTLGERFVRLLPTIFITLGSLMIANVAWPIISYQVFVSPSLQKTELITPISQEQTVYYTLQSDSPELEIETPNPGRPLPVLGQEVDFTKASNWFPQEGFPDSKQSKITHYTISIPSVDLEEAIVSIGGEDLSDNIIHYPGTANPGQLGSPVLFGHSVLRQFYNPSKNNPQRYISIFSKIMTLEDGDEIVVDFDGIRYKYLVKDKFEVKPEDVFILEQRYNNRELKLVTCVPEGTYLRRGVVVAQLQDINTTRQVL